MHHAIEKAKAVKWRQWIILPVVPITIAALIANSIIVITGLSNFAKYTSSSSYERNGTGEGPTLTFSFYDLPSSSNNTSEKNNIKLRSKIIQAVGLEIGMLVILWVETVYFTLFFHRDDRVRRRCFIQAFLSITLIALAAVLKVSQDQVSGLSLDFPDPTQQTAAATRPDLTPEQFVAAYKSWLGAVVEDTGLVAFVISVVDAAVHLLVIPFWLWLLPKRHRLPDRYEPVVVLQQSNRKKKNSSSGASGRKTWDFGLFGRGLLRGRRRRVSDSESYELLSSTAAVGAGPLETVFREHERLRLLALNKAANAKAKRSKGVYLPSSAAGGPQFEPIVRYWMVNPLLDGAWWIVAVALAFFIVDPILEIVFYILNRKYALRCRWYCYLSLAYPWPIILWGLTIVVLLQLKIPFNRRLVSPKKGPRLDVVITIVALPFVPLWLLVHIMRFAEFSIDSDKAYQDYIESDPGRDSAYGTIAVLKILEVSFALIMAIGLSVLGHTVYKFYTAGRNSKTVVIR